MSRSIEFKSSVTLTEEERNVKEQEKSRLLITAYKDIPFAYLIRNNRLITCFPILANRVSRDNIYLGRVKNVQPNLNACFVEIENKEVCFLPMKECSNPFIVNRCNDGRVLEGDYLPVQIVKEAQKNKLAEVTAHISLPNPYFVYAFGNRGIGVSKKLDHPIRKSIHELLVECGAETEGYLSESWFAGDLSHLPEVGLVVRTDACKLISRNHFEEELYKSRKRFEQLLINASHSNPYAVLYKQNNLLNEINSRIKQHEYAEIVTDLPDIYDRLIKEQNDIQMLSCNVRFYQETLKLSSIYSLQSKLDNLLNERVWLKSGAFLVIQHTEAMSVIDVNSGKFEKKGVQNDYQLKVNLEAAEEIAYQLRARNLSGIIIIDFINLSTKDEKACLLEYLTQCVKNDVVNVHVIDMTPLGLVELTRKKVFSPLYEEMSRVTLTKNS